MARQRVQVWQNADFTGGLNIRDDAFQIPTNETPDCLNVRLLPQGGFHRRPTVNYMSNGSNYFTAARNLWAFAGNGYEHIIVQDDDDIYYGTGSTTWTLHSPDALTITGVMRAATMQRVTGGSAVRCYIQRNAEQVPFYWAGTAGTSGVLADASGAYNDNYAAPAGGKMPKARYIRAHNGMMFHAYVVEGGSTFPTRLRWSHPGEPEDYATNDYVDVGVDDGDVITGLASVGQVLYVFKARSVWAFTGYDSSTFQLQKVVDGVGAISQEAIAQNETEVFFFDIGNGVFALGPSKIGVDYSSAPSNVRWLWEKLGDLLTDGSIPSGSRSGIACGWMDNRLWVAVPWGTHSDNTRVFVFDPNLGKSGGWYPYNYWQGTASIGPFLEWKPANAAPKFFSLGSLAVAAGTYTQVWQHEYSETATSETLVLLFGSPATGTIESYYRTAWFTAGLPGVRKRFRRPTFVCDATVSAIIGLQSYKDFMALTQARSQQLTVSGSTGSGTLWGGANWNAFTWGETGTDDQQIVRGAAFGSAYAVQLKFTGPDGPWGLNDIELRYVPQRIR